LKCFDADGLTEDRAFGADDVAGAVYAGQRLRKLRFLMTDNSHRAADSTLVYLKLATEDLRAVALEIPTGVKA
jgi:hypothetical protein